MNWRITGTRLRRWKVSGSVTLQVAAVIWLVVLVNAYAFMHTWRVDLTEDRRFSIPEETKNLLATADVPVRAIVPYQFGRNADQLVRRRILDRAVRVLRELSYYSPRMGSPETVAVVREYGRWQRLREEFSLDLPNRVYLLCNGRRESLSVDDMATLRSFEEASPGVEAGIVAENVIGAIGRALGRVLSPDRPRVFVTQGHGEAPLESLRLFESAASDRGYDVNTLDLGRGEAIPAGASALVVVCSGGAVPFEPFSAVAAAEIERYLMAGGSMLLLAPTWGRTGIEQLLGRFGVRLRTGRVSTIGPTPRGVSGATTYLFASALAAGDPMGAPLRGPGFRAELADCRALEVSSPALSVLNSGAQTWLETNQYVIRRDRDEVRGPLSLIARSELRAAEGESARVVIVGSALAIHDEGTFRGGTRQLLLNALHWLSRQEHLAAGEPREDRVPRVVLDREARQILFWTSLFVLPLCPVLLGLALFAVRRYWR